MDPTQKEALIEEVEEEEEEEEEMKEKCCADCKTTKTPLWRSGPSGPKSLCNACGIRYRKKRSAMVGLNKGSEKRKEKSSTTTSTTTCAASGGGGKGSVGRGKGGGGGGKLGEDLSARVMALGKEVVLLQRQKRSPMKRQKRSRRRKLGEVEQAAVLLMSLSCGSVFA